MESRWGRAIDHRGAEALDFIAAHFGEPHRHTLLVAGGGFDPRTPIVAGTLAKVAGDRIEGVFIRERRPSPPSTLLDRAERNIEALRSLVPRSSVVDVEVFAPDGAVTIGRNVSSAFHARGLSGVTDVVVDLSALSIGASFPLTRLLLNRLRTAGQELNLHVMVTASPATDQEIRSLPSDLVRPVHGFSGQCRLGGMAKAAKLWMPQLRSGCGPVLERIHQDVGPHDIVPVLPFSSGDPRAGDALLEEFVVELEDVWGVDPRNVVYAAEDDPLDFYRTVLRIAAARRPVFEATGGSVLVLSPVGTKILALGAMLAAIEGDFTVLYVEAEGFEIRNRPGRFPAYTSESLVHVWLCGEAYTHHPEVLQSGGSVKC